MKAINKLLCAKEALKAFETGHFKERIDSCDSPEKPYSHILSSHGISNP